MVNKAYTTVQEMRLFATTCLSWNVIASDRWINLEDHFTNAYKAYFVTSSGFLVQHGYTNTMLAPGLPVPGGPMDNNSRNTLNDDFASHTMAYNAQAQCQCDKSVASGPS